MAPEMTPLNVPEALFTPTVSVLIAVLLSTVPLPLSPLIFWACPYIWNVPLTTFRSPFPTPLGMTLSAHTCRVPLRMVVLPL